MEMLYVIFLGFAVSLDSFIAGATYGARQIRISSLSLTIVGLMTVACTGVAMLLATLFGNAIDPEIAAAVGAALLLFIGVFSLFQEYLTRTIAPDHLASPQKLTLRVGKLLINIMADPEAVDFDHSKSISAGEAAMLGMALGLDNMAATFAASLVGVLPLYTPLVMGLIQSLLIWAGVHIACRYLPDGLKSKFSYFPGTLLILLGLTRLVK